MFITWDSWHEDLKLFLLSFRHWPQLCTKPSAQFFFQSKTHRMASAEPAAVHRAATAAAARKAEDQDVSVSGKGSQKKTPVCKECSRGECMQRKTKDRSKCTNPLVLNAPKNCACSLCHGKGHDSKLCQGAETTSMHSLVISTFSSEDDWSFSESEITEPPDLASLQEEEQDSVISIPMYLYDNVDAASTTLSGESEIEEHDEQEDVLNQVRRILQRAQEQLDEEPDEEENDHENQLKILSQVLGQPWYQSTRYCEICLDMKGMFLRPCCLRPVCDECMLQYLTTRVESALVVVECPMSKCQQLISRDEINARLPMETRVKFQRFLIDLNKEANKKTCPRCSDVMTIDADLVKKPKFHKTPYAVDCPTCYLKWCFPCHAPWHEGLTCKQYRKGDCLLRSWARQQVQGQVNARRCPSCKVSTLQLILKWPGHIFQIVILFSNVVCHRCNIFIWNCSNTVND